MSAGSPVSLFGLLRGAGRAFASAAGTEQELALSDGAELVVAQGLPAEAELARLGLGFNLIGSAVTPIAAVPTTAAHLSLYNAETGANARSLVIAAVGAVCTTTMAVAGQAVLLARNQIPGVNANPNGALPIYGASGKPINFAINAKASVTIVAETPLSIWIPTGAMAATGAATTIGLNIHNELYGRFIVPPGGMFSLATLAQTAAGSFQPYIFGYALPLTLG